VQGSEEEVWEVVEGWCAFSGRAPSHALLSTVRYGRMDTQYFRRRVALHPLLRDSPLPALVDAYQAAPACHPIPAFAAPRNTSEVLLVFGGWSEGNAVMSVSVYNPVLNSWLEAELELPVAWAYMAAVYHAGSVYLVGGRAIMDEARSHRQVWRLHLASLTWHKLTLLQESRNYLSTLLLNGNIYAVGGNNGRTRLNTVERYDISANQWIAAPSMRFMRSDAAAVALNGSIFAMGGFDGFNPVETMEEYKPNTGKWENGKRMSEAKSGIKAVAWRNKIYVTGGWNGNERLRSCEVFDPKTGKWRKIGSMATARSNHSLSVVNGRLVVAGGYDGTSTTAHVEMYDFETDTWSEVCPLAAKRSALSCCTVPLAALGPQLRERLLSRAATSQQDQTLLNPEPGTGGGGAPHQMEGLETEAEFQLFGDSDSEDEDMGEAYDWEGHNLSEDDTDME